MPYNPKTLEPYEWQKEENWVSFEEARAICKKEGFNGMGFVFKFPYIGIDLDNCIDDGFMNDLARDITNRIETYTEYSKSGNGLHLYCKTTEPIKSLKTKDVEIYGEGRFFIVTGKELDSEMMDITEQTENIKSLVAKYRPEQKQYIQTEATKVGEGERNNRLASEIGRMFNYWDKETVYNMAHTLNQTMCQPPLPDKEVDQIINSISKKETKILPPKQVEISDGFIEGHRDLEKNPYMGLALRKGKYIPTGISSIDFAMNDLAPCCVTLLTGRSNAGKSTFVTQIIANAISTQNKVFLVSGEGEQEMFINSLYQCVIGRDSKYYNLLKINKRMHKEPKIDVLDKLREWHRDKLTLFDKGESKLRTTEELFEMIEIEIKTNKCNLVVIDNLMSILETKATEKNEMQSEFMQKCHDLVKKYRAHLILVLHPNKEFRKGSGLDMEHISGTSDLYNKADNIIAVLREYDEVKIAEGISGKIELIKNRYYSNLVEVDIVFDVSTGLLLEIKDGKAMSYDFHWNKDEVKEWYHDS